MLRVLRVGVEEGLFCGVVTFGDEFWLAVGDDGDVSSLRGG